MWHLFLIAAISRVLKGELMSANVINCSYLKAFVYVYVGTGRRGGGGVYRQ